jgi:hypothetical protein
MSRRWAILVAGWLVFLVYAYPGFISPDTIAQLDQARGAPIGDWHPPVMVVMWRACLLFFDGTLPMLVLQSVTFLLGTEGVLRRFAPRAAPVLAVGVLLFPPVMAVMAVIWKDSQMAGYLIAGAAALLSPSRRWKVAGCGFLFLATAVRYNAFAASLPLVGLLFVWNESWSRVRRYTLALVVWLLVTASAAGANSLLATQKDYPWHNSVALFDLAGVVRFSHVHADAELRELLRGAPLVVVEDIKRRTRAVYSPRMHWQLTHGDTRIFDVPLHSQLPDVRSAWVRAVTTQPRAYLFHRWRVFQDTLGLRHANTPVWDESLAKHARIQALWIGALESVESSSLFRPYLYFLVAIALLFMSSRVTGALLASGLACELSLFVAAPSSDYRYSHWMIVCTTIACVAIFCARLTAARRARSHHL